ncbi:MAG: hypothetical protein ACFB0G_11155 [Leptolyngbyaceae cyanobacterium]
MDLTGYTEVGRTTPGPPASEGERLGVATLHVAGSDFNPMYGHDLYQCGDRYHLWRGDWLRTPVQIWHKGSSYLAYNKPS